MEPVTPVNEPGSHRVAEVAPVVSTYDPGGAAWQGSAPVAEKVPGEHSAGGTVVVVVVVVEDGAVTFTFFCTVALSPSASVTVSRTVLRPRVENVRVGLTSVEVDPSGNCQRYEAGPLVTVDSEPSNATVNGDSPLSRVGSVVIFATTPRWRTGVVWPATTAVFFPAAAGRPRFWLTTPLMPSAVPISGAQPEAPGTANELLTSRKVPFVR